MKVKVGIAQMSCVENKSQNIERYTEKVRQLAADGAQIICLQELFASLYFCDEERYQNFALAEPIPDGPTTRHFMALAKELGVVIVCSMFEKRAEGLYHNTTAVIDADGSYLGKYRKMHIPDDPGYYEKFYFTPGDLGYKVFKTKFATIGVLRPWQTIQRSHAVVNGVPVVSVNRTGLEGGMQFWGGSFITNAFGRILYQAPHLEEALHVEELDLDETDHYRRHWPYFRDRRIDSYQPILNRYID